MAKWRDFQIFVFKKFMFFAINVFYFHFCKNNVGKDGLLFAM
jgi:hypothetical protein